MKGMSLLVWGVLTILLLLFQESFAGVVIEQRVKDREGRPSKVILFYSEGRLRTDHIETGLTTIINFKDDQMVMIEHPSKSYVEVKLSQWEKEAAKELRKENPAIMPKERRISVKKTGESATLNGFKTEKIQVFADGELIEEHWVTRDLDLGEVEKVMERAAQGFSKEFRSEMREGQEIQKKLKPYGFSILIKDYAVTYGLGPVDLLEVKKIEEKELKNEVFLPPSGYTRITPKSPKK